MIVNYIFLLVFFIEIVALIITIIQGRKEKCLKQRIKVITTFNCRGSLAHYYPQYRDEFLCFHSWCYYYERNRKIMFWKQQEAEEFLGKNKLYYGVKEPKVKVEIIPINDERKQ